jgi:hypothetical protein
MALPEFDRQNAWMLTTPPARINELIQSRLIDIQYHERSVREYQERIAVCRKDIARYQYIQATQGHAMWTHFDMFRGDVQAAMSIAAQIHRQFNIPILDVAFKRFNNVSFHIGSCELQEALKLLLDAFVWTRLVNDGDHAIATRVLGFL